MGKLVIGRKGQPTRLSLDKSQLAQYIEAGPSTPPWGSGSSEAAEEVDADDVALSSENATQPPAHQSVAKNSIVVPAKPATAGVKVFISHGSNMEIVDQVQTMLGIADIPSEVAVKEETSAIPVPERSPSSSNISWPI
ncbi:MAG: hypothetical protein ACE14L_14155 [Terriglobales bacterium]